MATAEFSHELLLSIKPNVAVRWCVQREAVTLEYSKNAYKKT
jgi:hypothetical protein